MSREANERRMRTLVARWRKEGGSAASFAARHRLSPTKFGYWRRRHQRLSCRAKTTAEAGERIEFRPLHLVGPAAPTRALLEIALPGGERVLVHEGATTELVAAAVTAARASGTQC